MSKINMKQLRKPKNHKSISLLNPRRFYSSCLTHTDESP